jgi:tetratricopeptide (TPR) repeat protein
MSRRHISMRTFVVLAALMLTAAAPHAFPEPPANRDDALAALHHADAAARAEAIVWIANFGGMDDTGLLHERLRDESPFVRRFAEQGLWLLWSRSGDDEIDALMARGVEHMQAGRYAESIGTFSEAIRAMPQFAEAWNKRATVLYLAGRFRESIADCDEVLKRNPRHFGALSGLGQIYVQLELPEQALEWYRRALEVNPNMLGVALSIQQIEEQLRRKRGRET